MKTVALSKRLLLLTSLSFLAAIVFILGGSQSSLNGSSFKVDISFVSAASGAGDNDVVDESIERRGCILPTIDPDPSWIPSHFDPLSCIHRSPDLVSVVEGGFVFNTLPTNSCSYSEVSFVDDFVTKKHADAKILPTGKSTCPSEVFSVSCVDTADPSSNRVVFESLFRCFFKKPFITERVMSPKFSSKTTNNQSNRLFAERLNILMFGLDSVSRVAWLEQMQKTTEFMTNTLNAFSFGGYNIVGDGTTAAILGLTTGYLEEELHESRRGYRSATTVDDFPLIWRQLADEAGYTTLWDEDGASLGTFHYRLTGFKTPPVDYYGRLFQLQLEQKYPNDACLGTMSTFQEMAQLFRQLFVTYPDPVRKFGLVFNSHFSHTSSGEGGQSVYRVDEILRDELKWLADNGHLRNSVVILFADHGSRYDGSRATHRGKISERLPYLAMAFPSWFVQKYPRQFANLKMADKRLTTPFDLHATLLDIGGLQAKPGTPSRGLSFFKPIPIERTCEDAGVSPHWCACLSKNQGSVLASDDELATRSLGEFENYVNNHLLASFIDSGECVALKAVRPFAAQKLSLRQEVAQFVKTIDGHGRKPQFNAGVKPVDGYVQVSFWTEPGNGRWEVTLTHNITSGVVSVLPKQISRTNRYGSAPRCVQDRFPHLRQFCFCKSNL